MKAHLLLCAATAILMTGCTDSNDAENEEVKVPTEQPQSTDDQNDSEDKNETETETEEPAPQQDLTSEEIIHGTAKLLKTDVPVKVPVNLTINPNYH